MKSLRAVGARARNSRGIIGPFSPPLHGEGRMAMTVNVRVGAVVFSWSGSCGEIFRGSADLPPG